MAGRPTGVKAILTLAWMGTEKRPPNLFSRVMTMRVIGCTPSSRRVASKAPHSVWIGATLSKVMAASWMRVTATPRRLNTASSRRWTMVSALARASGESVTIGVPRKTTRPVKGDDFEQKKPAGMALIEKSA